VGQARIPNRSVRATTSPWSVPVGGSTDQVLPKRKEFSHVLARCRCKTWCPDGGRFSGMFVNSARGDSKETIVA